LEDVHRENGNMTDEERQPAFADIYGTGKALPETPELFTQKLIDLQVALDDSLSSPGDTTTTHSSSQACQMAHERLPAYVTSPKFLLPFLRAELFDVEAAVKKTLQC
jgi:hypothetical protein